MKFISEIKKFKTQEILLLTSKLAHEMLCNNKTFMQGYLYSYTKYLRIKKGIIITPWGLNEISYLAVINCNEYSTEKLTEDKFLNLYNLYIEYDSDNEISQIKKYTTTLEIEKFMFGLARKTFWYQELHKVPQAFNRDTEIVDFISNEFEDEIDIDTILEERIGFNAKDTRLIIFTIFSLALKKINIADVDEDGTLLNISPILTKENVLSIINTMTCNYSEVRKSPLNDKVFYLKPIIKINDDLILIVSPFNLSRKIYEYVFWEIRNHYFAIRSQAFTNSFGLYFETYIEKLLSQYLSVESFEKIPETEGTQRADWLLKSDRYNILIEQKSSISPITIRDNLCSQEQVDTYLSRLSEAIDQLHTTENDLLDQTVINPKIILLYEDIEFTENYLKKRLFQIKQDHAENSNEYIIMNCHEFEWLIKILSDNQSDFNEIIEAKINMNDEESRNGADMSQIIPKLSEIKPDYSENVLNHYQNMSLLVNNHA